MSAPVVAFNSNVPLEESSTTVTVPALPGTGMCNKLPSSAACITTEDEGVFLIISAVDLAAKGETDKARLSMDCPVSCSCTESAIAATMPFDCSISASRSSAQERHV